MFDARRRAPRRRGRSLRSSLLIAVVAAVLALAEPASAAFSALTSNAGSSLATASTFPNYPTTVAGDSPTVYHRADDSPGAQRAVGSTSPVRHGLYDSGTTAPTTW
ncbi:MAG: hypothetical protein M3Q27_00790 [Actinomycetota bacterium]|nr:hypothetical protein [Actinomycetota bacterium]